MNTPPDSAGNSLTNQPPGPSPSQPSARQPTMSSSRQPSRGGDSVHRPSSSSAPSASSSSSVIAPATGPVNEEELFAHLQPSPPASLNASLQAGGPSIQGTIISALDEVGSSSGGLYYGQGDYDDEDDLGMDMSNYPASMTSSIRAHVYEGGLRYHAFRDGRYAFPNDETEQNRDDMKHAMTLMLMKGRHHYAPVKEVLEGGGQVYDLGTGTGIWVMELADTYPDAVIRGCDLSPIQPNFIPPNVHFVVDDFEDEWLYPENLFDYIHVRHTIHSIRDRKTLLERCYKHLKPGGYLEFQELQFVPKCDDDTLTDATPYAFRDFLGFLDAGLRALGSELNSIVRLPDEMLAAGFDGVHLDTHKCPVGVWPRDKRLRYCGLFMRTAIMDGLRGLVRRPFGTGLGWTQLQIEMFLIEVRRAVMDAEFHTYLPLHAVYGQKPVGEQDQQEQHDQQDQLVQQKQQYLHDQQSQQKQQNQQES